MAKIHPQELSEAYSAHSIDSEKLVFLNFARELNDQYHVFHDLKWNDPSLDDSKTAGQVDFVIAHPEYGFIALEVKGGRCDYDPALRAWTSTNREDVIVDIRDPFEQAQSASRVLMKLLKRRGDLGGRFIPHHYAAAFPDCTLAKRDIRADALGWQIFDQESLSDSQKSIDQLFAKSFPAGKISKELGHKIIRGLSDLHGDRALQGTKSAIGRLGSVREKQVALTEAQQLLLRSLSEFNRLLIQGCAGSGKTTLALHKAKLLAGAGYSVLLVCFNIPLSKFLRAELQAWSNIEVGSFHRLCLKWLKDSGVPATPENTDQWWSMSLPGLVVDQLDKISARYDAIVVDEGQDFKDPYWIVLEFLLRDPDRGILYVFADASQDMYKGRADLPIKSAPVKLQQNIRNTNQVFEVVQRTCDLPVKMLSSGVDGPKVEFFSYDTNTEMAKNIEKILTDLVADGFNASDIAILGTKSQERTTLKHGNRIGPFRLVAERERSFDIIAMTVHRFKGLESPVVILCELDQDIQQYLAEILYVGLTRSTYLLYVLCSVQVCTVLNEPEVS